MELLGLFGENIGYSYSPAIHQAALRETGRGGGYLLWSVTGQDLRTAVQGAWLLGARGANVTTPHKEAVAGLVQALDPSARRVGAVNVLVRSEEGWIGHNTDADGFWSPLAALGRSFSRALVLGTGGASRAVCGVLAQNGVRTLVAGRDREKLGRLAALFDVQTVDWTRRAEDHGCDLIVNATTVGLHARESPLQLEEIPPAALVYDLIYRPRETELLRLARRRGCRTIGGSGMLLAQAMLAWRLWYGEQPPHRAMAKALEIAMSN